VPALTYFIVKIVPLDQPLAIAMLLLGTGAGAPFAPKLTEFARGNLAFAVELMVLLISGTVVYMPIVSPLLPTARVGSWLVAEPLVTPYADALTLLWIMHTGSAGSLSREPRQEVRRFANWRSGCGVESSRTLP
jgi:predicted Na+-dependent transporter